jgi:hypothetical protein
MSGQPQPKKRIFYQMENMGTDWNVEDENEDDVPG